MPIELYPSVAKIKRNGVYENLPGFVPETGSVATQQMIATGESINVAQYVHNKGEYFRLNDTLYQAIVKINVGDNIVVGTNCEVAVIGNDLTHVANSIAAYELGIATSSHNTGDYFMVGETLYVATSDIQVGDTISTSTNCRLAVVGDELSGLKTAISDNGYYELVGDDIQQGEWNNHAISSTTSRLCTKKLYPVQKGMQIKYNTSASLYISFVIYDENNAKVYDSYWIGGTDTDATFICDFTGDIAITWKRVSGSYMSVSTYTNSGAYTRFVNSLGARVAILEEKAAEEDADSMTSYWATYMSTKIPDIQAKTESVGLNGDNFIFLTDYHYDPARLAATNNGHSPALVRDVFANTNIEMFVFGGDSINGNASQETAIAQMREVSRRFHGLPMYGLYGNHEYNLTDGGSASVMIDSSVYYTLFIKDVEDKIVKSGTDYYRDNANQKIRYIFMDTKYETDDSAVGIITDDQINWMKARLTELESGWYAVVFCHQYFAIGMSPSATTPTYSTSGAKVKAGLSAALPNMSATLIGVICGHVHFDYSYESNGFLEISVTTDSMQAQDSGYVDGTTTEQAFDVFSVDLANEKVYATRVGRGTDREWDFA